MSYSQIIECEKCPKIFKSRRALEQHLNSPAHAFDCEECHRSFGSQGALEQHLNSPAHAFNCEECDRSFGSRSALEQITSSTHFRHSIMILPCHLPRLSTSYNDNKGGFETIQPAKKDGINTRMLLP